MTRPRCQEGGAAKVPSPQASWEHKQPQALQRGLALGLLPTGLGGTAHISPGSLSSSPGPASQTVLALRPETTKRGRGGEQTLSVHSGPGTWAGRALLGGEVGSGVAALESKGAQTCVMGTMLA